MFHKIHVSPKLVTICFQAFNPSSYILQNKIGFTGLYTESEIQDRDDFTFEHKIKIRKTEWKVMNPQFWKCLLLLKFMIFCQPVAHIEFWANVNKIHCMITNIHNLKQTKNILYQQILTFLFIYFARKKIVEMIISF